MPKLAPRNYIYPLNPKSKQGYTIDKAGKHTTSLENFFEYEIRDYLTLTEWGLTTNFRQIKKDDLIWVHFVLPIGEIRAVGVVDTDPYQKAEWNSEAIKIHWNKKLTEALLACPIRIHQRNLRGASTPSDQSQKTIKKWLQQKSTQAEGDSKSAVAFRTATVKQRLGQPEFRQRLLRAYKQSCAVTGCKVNGTLQAAHIRGVKVGGTHSVKNGLILRADIHNLFDLGLITVDEKYRILVSDTITDQKYRQLNQRFLKIPESRAEQPDKKLLAQHRAESLLIKL